MIKYTFHLWKISLKITLKLHVAKGKLIYMTRAWNRWKKNLSTRQESNPWPPEHRAGVLSTKLREPMERKVILTFNFLYLTGVLHTARINTVEVIISSDKWIKMVTFVLGNKCETGNKEIRKEGRKEGRKKKEQQTFYFSELISPVLTVE